MHIKKLQEIQKNGHIKGFIDNGPAKNFNVIKTKSVQKDWLSYNLNYWANKHQLQIESEYKFLVDRRFRFDWCLPGIKVAIEYEGIFNKGNNGHTGITGFLDDVEKYNEATVLGYRILRCTAHDYKNILRLLDRIILQYK